MSVVTSITFISSYVSTTDTQLLLDINFSHPGRGNQHLKRLPRDWEGGNKLMECDIFGAGINHCNHEAFSRIADLGLTGILVVVYQDSVIPEVYTFHNGKVARIQEPTFDV